MKMTKPQNIEYRMPNRRSLEQPSMLERLCEVTDESYTVEPKMFGATYRISIFKHTPVRASKVIS
jgi:hypothetical protein